MVNKGLEVTDDIVGVMCGNDDLATRQSKSWQKTVSQDRWHWLRRMQIWQPASGL